MTHHHCPLCLSLNIHEHGTGEQWPLKGAFYFCTNCKSVFKDPKNHLVPEAEKARYDLHNNSIEDSRYIQYLKKSWNEFIQNTPSSISRQGVTVQEKPSMLELQSPNLYTKELPLSDNGEMSFKTILDYGCGPVKALEYILQSSPYEVQSWDKYYHTQAPTRDTFDVIFCHEVVEHFTYASRDFDQLLQFAHQGSFLFLSTELYPQDFESFKKWYYKNDPTHVIFYQKESFEFLAQKHQLKCLGIFGNNKILLQKL
ncbi:MAG: class I SAM-dependent methyltransferase [Bdellovibrionaceae bacterium]|nr:class I SAM-dependent methyltransferase [Pseudobdellovibrionaceae bacterium]